MLDVSNASSAAAAAHLSQHTQGHMYTKEEMKQHQHVDGHLSLWQAFQDRVGISERTANAIGNFNLQGF